MRPRFPWILAFGLAGCAAETPPELEHVLLVTLDTTRADVLDGSPASLALAPHIGALAAAGVRFPHAYSVAPLTLPAHASLLTGLVPPRHGLRDNGREALAAEAKPLAESLAGAGFATAAFVSSVVLDRGFGLAQGFELYDQPELDRSERHAHAERPAHATVRAALDWLAARRDQRPFFLWVHLYDAHLPYEPASEHLERAGGDPYRGEIAALDEAVSELLAGLERAHALATTLVVLTADHGESLGEHGEPTHGALCYESTMRVPLLFRFPGVQPEPGPAHFASLVDVTPTVLARFGLEPTGELDGIDLFAPDGPAGRGVYLESLSGYFHYGWSPLVGWLDTRGKYLHSSQPEFYLPLQDPAERVDLASSHGHEAQLALANLARLTTRTTLLGAPRSASAALEEALGALGYARGASESAPDLLAASTLPAPRARAHELAPLLRAHALLEAGRFAECLPLASEITRENPGHTLALDLEALCLMQLHDFRQAEAILRRRIALEELADGRLNLGLCRFELGDPEEAQRELERARELAPESPEIARELARVRARL
ncbi:MAG: sulfatase-like hydrolase/transferase, partial [Planctomycetota bacterium]